MAQIHWGSQLSKTDSLNQGPSFDVNQKENAGGVYNLRNRSQASLSRRPNSKVFDEDAPDEDAGLHRESDWRGRQVFHGRTLFWLSYQSIGAIYGDIGTSPLYVFSSTFTSAPSYENLTGALSIIIWSLFMMVTVKYILVILRADNAGEGGTFSTYSLLSRFALITNRDPRELSLVKMERVKTKELPSEIASVRGFLERSTIAKAILKIMGVLAVSMVMSDGILTPAQSVLGAVQGISVVNDTITKPAVIGTTCGILILLFVIQPFGLTKLSTSFAPIVIIWLTFNAAFGVYNLVIFDHSVLKAFNPGLAFEYLIRNKTDGWRSLGGILLAFTGVEALFADLGAFSRRAIQLSWLCFAFPCLLLAYIGQAAYISIHPTAYSNPFFNSVPPGMLYPSLIVAILAAIVASQAIITATFQLMAQIMKLSYFPQIKVVHTSKIFHGQLYVPSLNWLMMIGTVLVAAIFNNTTSLGNAYGVCVMFVTFFDTCMVSLAALVVWRVKLYYVLPVWLTIACLDGTYLSSVLTKVPDGAWFTLLLAIVLACLFILWRYGKEKQWAAEAGDRFPTSHFVKTLPYGEMQLAEQYGGSMMSTFRGLGVFFDKAGETAPIVFSQFVSKFASVPEFMIFFHLRPLEVPSAPSEDRYTISKLAIPNCYRVVIRYGYMDEVITPNLASLLLEKVRDFMIRSPAAHSERKVAPDIMAERITADKAGMPENNKDGIIVESGPEDAIPRKLTELQDAYNHQVLYIVGKEQMRVRPGTGFIRQMMLKAFLFIRDNTRTKIASLKVPVENLVEVGFLKEI